MCARVVRSRRKDRDYRCIDDKGNAEESAAVNLQRATPDPINDSDLCEDLRTKSSRIIKSWSLWPALRVSAIRDRHDHDHKAICMKVSQLFCDLLVFQKIFLHTLAILETGISVLLGRALGSFGLLEEFAILGCRQYRPRSCNSRNLSRLRKSGLEH
ncbi:hypothetical protein KC333_g25 [Hortaea werneckii]|nr:hypothetical protein KC333_g25 [Hortaea werneckii]